MKLDTRFNTAMAGIAAMAVTALAFVADGRVRAEPPTPDVASVLEQGDMLTRHSQFAAARAAYESAVQMARSEGRLPARELRRIANAYYFEGQYSEAATTLRQLADEASASQDWNTQALAIVDAVWMSALAGSSEETQLREQLQELASSSALSERVRDAISADAAGHLRVLAPHITAG